MAIFFRGAVLELDAAFRAFRFLLPPVGPGGSDVDVPGTGGSGAREIRFGRGWAGFRWADTGASTETSADVVGLPEALSASLAA